MEMILNKDYGGFGLSSKACTLIAERKGISDNDPYLWNYDKLRYDKDAIAVVKELGEKASGMFAKLVVVDIPYDYYHMTEYDGYEEVYCSAAPIEIK